MFELVEICCSLKYLSCFASDGSTNVGQGNLTCNGFPDMIF